MTEIQFRNLPGMSPLFLDYLNDWTKVSRFYGNSYSIESIVAFGRRRAAQTLPHREVLCRCLAQQQREWGGGTEAIEKLAGGAVAVVAGQQPGLFTGPHYTILKAITAIKLSGALNEAGLPAVPVFWVASEDHDFEEIAWASVMDRDSALRRFQVDLANQKSSPVGWLRFGEDLKSTMAECIASLPPSEFQPELRELLEFSYRPGSSPAESFARMMVRLFGASGLIVADPLHPELKSIAAPVLQQVVERNEEIRNAVVARSRAVSEAGYHEQVKVDDGFTGLFSLRDGERRALKPGDIRNAETLSPNVLVRGVVQDTIFPTAAFVAGPAEIAYIAQAAAVYQTLGRELSPVYPRISTTVLESRVMRALRKYDVDFCEVFQGREHLKRKAVGAIEGSELFAKVKQNFNDGLESLRNVLTSVDPTLAGALDTSRQKVIYQVDTLETKFVNAETRRNEVMEKQIDLIGNSIFPEKKLQERLFNVTSFIARYGIGFVKRLEQSVSLDSRQHQLIEL